MARNPEVDEWFAGRDHPMEDAMQAVRSIALGAAIEAWRDGKDEG